MVDIIRQRSVTTTNTLNKWPSNGLYTQCHSLYNRDKRKWFNLSIDDVEMVIGNLFEQVDEYSLSFTLNARVNYADRRSPYINMSVTIKMSESMPIESQERHELTSFLYHRINQGLLVSDVITFKINCHVKGWFWS